MGKISKCIYIYVPIYNLRAWIYYNIIESIFRHLIDVITTLKKPEAFYDQFYYLYVHNLTSKAPYHKHSTKGDFRISKRDHCLHATVDSRVRSTVSCRNTAACLHVTKCMGSTVAHYFCCDGITDITLASCIKMYFWYLWDSHAIKCFRIYGY